MERVDGPSSTTKIATTLSFLWTSKAYGERSNSSHGCHLIIYSSTSAELFHRTLPPYLLHLGYKIHRWTGMVGGDCSVLASIFCSMDKPSTRVLSAL
ncbi:hypothetical protein Ae201684P_000941 [Aphanomyces euteiches]|uniref:Uncharacterized protein n=1 Tax=Aphanomyces euteiches TaxID=100861 RepID=A0A6G0XRH3_9STRA|nr:hypothetical protein Ae201684_002098 [Aphanomyces euteiches]KAH9087539.1 hypothetical protein Ae201684P_000941 [Aphanomyces euteiches]